MAIKRKRKPPAPKPSFTVIRDTREHEGHGWDFPANESTGCAGTVLGALPTGDYSLKGYQKILSIERKLSTAEFGQNLTQERFTRELQRLQEFEYAYVILEFTAQDVNNFPAGSGIPRSRWRYIRMTPDYFWKRLVELMMEFKGIQFILAGDSGQYVAETIFKWVAKNTLPDFTEEVALPAKAKRKAPSFRPKRSTDQIDEPKEGGPTDG